MKIGDRIKKARETAGLSMDELAEKLGVTYETVRGWEKHKAVPRPSKYSSIADALGISEGRLVLGIADKGPKAASASSEFEQLFDSLTRDQRVAVLALLKSMNSSQP